MLVQLEANRCLTASNENRQISSRCLQDRESPSGPLGPDTLFGLQDETK